MFFKILAVAGAAAVAVTSFVLINNKKVDYDASVSKAYSEQLLEKSEFPFSVGINVNGLEGEWRYDYSMRLLSKQETYDNITRQGFDHIRIPIDFRRVYSADTKKLDEAEMKKFDRVLDLAEEAGLYTTIDFHGWYDIDSAKAQDKDMFLTIWGLVAERYKDRSELISFELMNEPSIKTLPAHKLNVLQNEAIAIIRKTNPTRLIVCAAPDGNQPWQLGELKLPEDDNLAVAVHIYHPGDFTHQGFTWAGREAGKQVRLDDKMRDELRWNLNETKKFIDSTGIPVILNEFGLNLSLAEREDSSWYLSTITEFCRENGIPWTYWQYDDDAMGLYHRGTWDVEAMDALFLKDK